MRKILPCIWLILLLCEAKAQINDQPGYKFRFDQKDVVPVMGKADNLGVFGDPKFNASTGTPSISFTIYKISVGDMEVPISISYDATGIRYSDIPTSVGMKWRLDAGGSIDRSINGYADEDFLLNNLSWLDTSVLNAKTNNMHNTQAQMESKRIVNGGYDMTADNYYYNFNGRSGSMYLTKTGQFVFDKDYSKLTLTYLSGFSGFTIKDESGNTYFFGSSYDVSRVFNTGRLMRQAGTEAKGSFKLDRITTASGRNIDFQYETYTVQYNQLNSETWVKAIVIDHHQPKCGTRSDSNPFSTSQFFNTVNLLKKIFTEDEEVLFKYADNNTLPIWKRQLQNISVVSKISGDTVKRFSFRHNGNFLEGFDELDTSRNVATRHSFAYQGSTYIDPFSKSRDMFGYYNGAVNSNLIARNLASTGYPGGIANRSVTAAASAGILNEITYPTGGKTRYEYEINTETIGGITYYGAGLRLKSSKDIDRDNKVYHEKKYYYKNMLAYSVDPMYAEFQESTSQGSITQTYYSDNPNSKPGPTYYLDVLTENIAGTEKQYSRDYFLMADGIYQKSMPLPVKNNIYYGNDTNFLLKSVVKEYERRPIDSVKLVVYKMKKTIIDTDRSSPWLVDEESPNQCDFTFYTGYEYDYENRPVLFDLIKETTKNYVPGTTDSLIQTVDLTYHRIDPYPYLLKTQKTTNSKKKDEAVEISYPFNYTSDPLMVQMVQQSRLSNPVLQKQSVDNVPVMEKKNLYEKNVSNRFVLKEQRFKNLIKLDSQSLFFYKYDFNDRMLETGKKGDIRISYAWLGKTMQPTAIVTNASDTSFAYTSFEYVNGSADTHGWSFTLLPWPIAGGVTGKHYLVFNNTTLNKTNLVSGKRYIISYWSRNGSYTIGGGTVESTKQGNTYNGWTYVEHEVLATSTTLSISSVSGDIDELRLYPKGATMATYAYQHLRGVSTACDANNRLSFYEYDKSNRLSVIRDQDGNIIKTVEYHIQGIQ